MRLLMINLLATAMLLVGAGAASAYQLNLVATTPTDGIAVGDLVTYEVYLNTEGLSSITLFTAAFSFDPNVVAYRSDLSAQNSYFPLYALGNPKQGTTTAWLEPVPFPGDPNPGDPGNTCSLADPLCANPAKLWTGNQPPVGAQVNVSFKETNLNPTTATATNLLMARLTFEAVGFGTSAGAWSFTDDFGGTVFSVADVDITAPEYAGPLSVTAGGTQPLVSVIPEPTTALLVGLGLVGLGVAGRRRA